MQTWFGPGRRAVVLLAVAVAGLAGGLWARLAGAGQFGDRVLTLIVAPGLVPLTVSVARALVRREPGVDVVAPLAMAGALALGEVLAGAVIAVMLASGRLLETYAGRLGQTGAARPAGAGPAGGAPLPGRRAGLATAGRGPPRGSAAGQPGEVVPVDGLIQGRTAVLDESALTGEAELVERGHGDQVRSGVVNAGSPSTCGRRPRPRPAPTPVFSGWSSRPRHPRHRSCGWPTIMRSPSCR